MADVGTNLSLTGESHSEVFVSSNMIVVFANIIFFMIVQTLFFKYVASKQFNIVLEDKADIVEQYLKHDSKANLIYKKFRESGDAKTLRELAEKQEAERESINTSNTMMWIGIPFIIGVLFLVFFVGRLYFKSEVWDSVDTILLSFVVFAYATEILFYLGIVRKYQFYGDQSIYSNVYSEINDNVNKEPVTPEGKKLQANLEEMVSKISQIGGDASTYLAKVRKFYNDNKEKFAGVDEHYVIAYVKNRATNVTDFVNFNTLNMVGKYTDRSFNKATVEQEREAN
ncbi:hypothetical protein YASMINEVIRUS_463 [Yasminevirus sp. GU-2018]|uniref:Uncharacterized protein n=1 Tax=Yasminevirus sp. GU-2018 TaxID=2420051 RepID=A0A5K0U865_9VIRU|nr:hypothetical protein YASMINEVIRUS_463 [Yasminevirus sp. GU-2018]